MMGYYAMPRADAIVRSIASGIDIILGINDIEEDVAAMKTGLHDGRITPQRLRDAVCRILATKAAIGLHTRQREGTLVPPPGALKIVGDPQFKQWAVDLADASITLVKDTRGQLPLRPEAHPRLLVNFLGNEGTRSLMGKGVAFGGSAGAREQVLQALERAGFQVTLYQPGSVTGKGSIRAFKQNYDAALIFADVSGFAHINALRLDWGESLSAGCPWYVPEIPTVFISLNLTNHMIDVPRVPVFINAYNDQPATIDLVIRKLMRDSPFKGHANDNVWCGLWDTHF